MRAPSLLFGLMMFSPIPQLAQAGGTDVGNGGDFIRATFVRVGVEILNHLVQNQGGRNLVKREGLDVQILANTLMTDRIFVRSEKDFRFIDNRGAAVDAVVMDYTVFSTGEKHYLMAVDNPAWNSFVLVLRKESWEKALRSPFNIHMLVFHEMLRLAYWTEMYPLLLSNERLADDNYVISRQIADWIAIDPAAQGFHTTTGLLQTLADDPLLDLAVGTPISVTGAITLHLDPKFNIYAPSKELPFRSGRASCELTGYSLQSEEKVVINQPYVVEILGSDSYFLMSVARKDNPVSRDRFDAVEMLLVGGGLPTLRIRCTNQAVNRDLSSRPMTVAHFNRVFDGYLSIKTDE